MRNHARAIVACDFVTVVPLNFTRRLYVLVVMEIASRKILHVNVTEHPSAAWTTQQLREAIPADHAFHYLIHDRDSIFSSELDAAVRRLGIAVLKSPPRSPKANAFCERLIGSMRRESLDFMIPLGQGHLRYIVRQWAEHYNRGRPHTSLGPAIPDPPQGLPVALQPHRHRWPADAKITSTSVLGGLHHEYRLETRAA